MISIELKRACGINNDIRRKLAQHGVTCARPVQRHRHQWTHTTVAISARAGVRPAGDEDLIQVQIFQQLDKTAAETAIPANNQNRTDAGTHDRNRSRCSGAGM